MAGLADLLAQYRYATTPGGAVTGRALRDDPLRGELGNMQRPDGGFSTELSITETDPRLMGGAPTNLPLMVSGQVGLAALLQGAAPTGLQRQIAIARAIERMQAGGMPLQTYPSIDAAVGAAEARPTDAKIPYWRGTK